MTRSRAKELLPIIQAFADGKIIQSKSNPRDEWSDADNAMFYDSSEYRIKPTPREFWIEYKEQVFCKWSSHPIEIRMGADTEIIHVREVIEP